VGESINLRAMVKDKLMLILVDCGSSHNFISSSFLQKCGISPVSMPSKKVTVANGETLITDKQVENFEWWLQGFTFITDMKVLDVGPYDAILGYDWLKPRSPMICHCENKTLSFIEEGTQVFLQGVVKPLLTLEEISFEKLVKHNAGNDINSYAVVEVIDSDYVPSTPVEVHALLDEYADIFSDPKTLPPSRFHDHHIDFLPNSILSHPEIPEFQDVNRKRFKQRFSYNFKIFPTFNFLQGI
jgi:hypothetical protein